MWKLFEISNNGHEIEIYENKNLDLVTYHLWGLSKTDRYVCVEYRVRFVK